MPHAFTPYWQVKERLREMEENLFVAALLFHMADALERKTKKRRPKKKARKGKKRRARR